MDNFILPSWIYLKSWLDVNETNYWNSKLINNLKWQQPTIKIYGRKHLTPRKTVFLGQKGITYNYSGVFHRALGWPDWFMPLLNKVNERSEVVFNGCLLNLYRNGSDSMGWHSDNEPELDEEKPISSLSLGASRDFFYRNNKSNITDKIILNDGDLLIMKPSFQKE